MSKYSPTFSIEFTPRADWLQWATGNVRGYRWWVLGPLSFHVIWSATEQPPLGFDNPDMMKRGTPLK